MTADVRIDGESSAGRRLDVLDFLRGIAVLGILVINIESFAYPDAFSPYKYGFDSELDRDFRFWTYFLFQGKFFAIFAVLFGVGFYLFLERALSKGRNAVDLYAHRMLWLFVIGLLHAFVLWPGDILYHYAVCGLLLLPARAMSQRMLLVWIVVLALAIAIGSIRSTQQLNHSYERYQSALGVAADQRSDAQLAAIEKWDARSSPRTPAVDWGGAAGRMNGLIENLALNIQAVRIGDGQIFYRGILFRTLLLMLCGVLAYRLGIFQDTRRLPGYWSITSVLVAAGLTTNAIRHWHWAYSYWDPVLNIWVRLAHDFCKELGGLGYLLLLNGLYQVFLRARGGRALSRVGRMALTNYLMQSVIAGLVFYGYGLGLFGSVSRTQLWLVIVPAWAGQIAFSVWWLGRYTQGPVEAWWRKMMLATSGSKQESSGLFIRRPAK